MQSLATDPSPSFPLCSEWMGYALLYESMLNSVLFARDKWMVRTYSTHTFSFPIGSPIVDLLPCSGCIHNFPHPTRLVFIPFVSILAQA